MSGLRDDEYAENKNFTTDFGKTSKNYQKYCYLPKKLKHNGTCAMVLS